MFDQLVVGAAPGDAITQCALVIRDALSQYGRSDLFAQYIEPGVEDRVRPIDELRRRPNADRPLIFHASIGSWPVAQALDHERDLILYYHNFSPPEFFAAFAPDVADDLLRGRWELGRIRDRVRLSIAASEYNAEELVRLGYDDVIVAPPMPDVTRLERIVPDVAMLGRLEAMGNGPLVLCVAQQLPHKRVERVLAAVAVLQQEYHPDARFVHVGVDRFEQYSRALRAMARTVGLRDPQFLGRVSDAELSALYVRARVVITLSEHEGFCVPVVEAMALGVPVVASARAAIPSTVGDAGILIDDPDDPVLVAGVLHEVITDETLRWILVGRGVSRSHRMSTRAVLPRVVDAVLDTLGPGRPATMQAEPETASA